MKKMLNGTLKTIAIIVAIVVTMGGLIWAFATQSGNLDGAIEDIAEQKEESVEIKKRVNTVEKAIIKIETNQGHMMTMQREILDELRR